MICPAQLREAILEVLGENYRAAWGLKPVVTSKQLPGKAQVIGYIERPFDNNIVFLNSYLGTKIVVMVAGSVIIIVMNRTLMELAGEDGVAAASIIQYTEELLSAIYLGYAEGIAPLMSYRQGTGEWKEVRRICECSLHIISVFAVATFLGSFLIASPLITAFSGDVSAVHDMAMHGFRIFAVSFLFMGFNTYASSLFTALNDGRTSALLSGGHSVCFLLCLLSLPRIFGLNGVWIAQPMAEFLALLMAMNCFRQRGFGAKPDRVMPHGM